LDLIQDPTVRTACAEFDMSGRFYHSVYVVQLYLNGSNTAWDSSRVACSHLELHVAKPMVTEEWRPNIGNLRWNCTGRSKSTYAVSSFAVIFLVNFKGEQRKQ
jgi:hypothetical protein